MRKPSEINVIQYFDLPAVAVKKKTAAGRKFLMHFFMWRFSQMKATVLFISIKSDAVTLTDAAADRRQPP